MELVLRDRLSLGFLSSWISLKLLGAALVPDLLRCGREDTGKAIFVPSGELLCKIEYVRWHSKYVSMKTGETKYTHHSCISE